MIGVLLDRVGLALWRARDDGTLSRPVHADWLRIGYSDKVVGFENGKPVSKRCTRR